MEQNFGYELNEFLNYAKSSDDPEAVKFVGAVLYNFDKTKSQNLQDVWALYESGFKRQGTFVEFGAADGIAGSNTYLLESEYAWKGLLAEPLPNHIAQLVSIRKTSRIVNKCVWTNRMKLLILSKPMNLIFQLFLVMGRMMNMPKRELMGQ